MNRWLKLCCSKRACIIGSFFCGGSDVATYRTVRQRPCVIQTRVNRPITLGRGFVVLTYVKTTMIAS